MTNAPLPRVWSQAYRALKEADQVVFCGYSFPDADMHIKYLLKRAQLNRDGNTRPLGAVLVNHHTTKTDEAARADSRRFGRFLGADRIWDTRKSFEEFALNPQSILDEAAQRLG
jgi:hypothetical protein